MFIKIAAPIVVMNEERTRGYQAVNMDILLESFGRKPQVVIQRTAVFHSFSHFMFALVYSNMEVCGSGKTGKSLIT